MANLEFNDAFIDAHATFQPYRISDHSPAVLRIPTCIVKDKWAMQFSGFAMYCVVQKLKSLKKPLQKLLYDQGNIHENVKRLKVELDKVPVDLDVDPFNTSLCENEAAYV
ncbi:hypothetical protein Tco_0334150 [Tanacetum coccineum]